MNTQHGLLRKRTIQAPKIDGLSDDEPVPFSAGSSEEFSPHSDSDSSLFEETQRKKLKIDKGKTDNKKPTSRNDNLPGRSNVDETIYEVISTM